MEEVIQTPDYWQKWDGKIKMINEIDHQHLSNIYWSAIKLPISLSPAEIVATSATRPFLP